MKLTDYINNGLFTNELPKINGLLSILSDATINLWGVRIIKVSGYEGSIPLDELSRKILNITQLKTPTDDKNGIKFIDLLTRFYHITDHQAEKSNLFTKTLNKIRDFSVFDKPLREQLGFIKEYIQFPQ